MGKHEDDRPEKWRDIAQDYLSYKSNNLNYNKKVYRLCNKGFQSPIDKFCEMIRNKYGLVEKFGQKEGERPKEFRDRCRKACDRYVKSLVEENNGNIFQQNGKSYYHCLYSQVHEILSGMRSRGEAVDAWVTQKVFYICAADKQMSTTGLENNWVQKARNFAQAVGIEPHLYALTARRRCHKPVGGASRFSIPNTKKRKINHFDSPDDLLLDGSQV